MTKVRPLGDRILVRTLEKDQKTGGGVFLPETVAQRDESERGEVLAVGPGTVIETAPPSFGPVVTGVGHGESGMVVKTQPRTEEDSVLPMRLVPVEVGQTVLFSPYAGSKVTVDGDNFLLLREADILGVLED